VRSKGHTTTRQPLANPETGNPIFPRNPEPGTRNPETVLFPRNPETVLFSRNPETGNRKPCLSRKPGYNNPVTQNDRINLKEAKARLSELVSRAEVGEETTITRHGRPVARLASARRELRAIEIERLQAITDLLPAQEDAGQLVRAIRDQSRY
jgi:prevent-host-death family protein